MRPKQHALGIGDEVALRPACAEIGQVRAGFFAPNRPQRTAIDHGPQPIDPVGCTELVQQQVLRPPALLDHLPEEPQAGRGRRDPFVLEDLLEGVADVPPAEALDAELASRTSQRRWQASGMVV